MSVKVRIKKLSEKAIVPQYGSELAAGADLYAVIDGGKMEIAPSETVFVKTGIALEIPVGYAGLVYARSGLASKKGLAPANKVGVIDADYRGEILVALYNQFSISQIIEDGERIAQLVITPFLRADFEETDNLLETERGSGGFGSTGRK